MPIVDECPECASARWRRRWSEAYARYEAARRRLLEHFARINAPRGPREAAARAEEIE